MIYIHEFELEQDMLEIAAVEARAAGRGSNDPAGCWNCGALDHISRACPSKKCSFCNMMGHSGVVCPTNPNRRVFPPPEAGKGYQGGPPADRGVGRGKGRGKGRGAAKGGQAQPQAPAEPARPNIPVQPVAQQQPVQAAAKPRPRAQRQ